MSSFERDELFGDRYTSRSLADFISPPPPIPWTRDNPYADIPRELVLEEMMSQVRWRYHHAIPGLRDTPGFYRAYADRVDALLEAIETAFELANLRPSEVSCIDIAAAEGYVTNWLFKRGGREIDALDLNEGNIERTMMVRAVKQIDPGRVGILDLDKVNWSKALDRTYDVTLALGIVYHLENPMLFLRNLLEITDGVAIIESDTPVFLDNQRFREFGIVYLHRDQVTLRAGNARYFTEMRPDRKALIEMILAAGFRSVTEVPAATTSPFWMYDSGEKSVLLATV